MIGIAMRPVAGAGVVKGEGLYLAEFKLGASPYKGLLYVRAKNARHAEEKLMFVFEYELPGKTLDFDLDEYKREGLQQDADVHREAYGRG